MDSRNVPGGGADGNIGGAERQYSGCERTVLKRNIAGFKEDDYSTMPLLMALPVPWLFASIVRCGCDIGLAYVIKKA